MSDATQAQPFGPDTSNHQGAVDMAGVREAGCSFQIGKVSQGDYFTDRYYQTNRARAMIGGLLSGGYHYLSYNSLPIDQVHYYLARVQLGPGDFGPIVDIENWSDAGEGGPPRSGAYMTQWASDFIEQVHTLTGRWCVIYSYVYMLNNLLNGLKNYATRCPLWIADYSHAFPSPVGWQFHTFHQYTSRGVLRNKAGLVVFSGDLNRFNGDMAGLRRMAGL